MHWETICESRFRFCIHVCTWELMFVLLVCLYLRRLRILCPCKTDAPHRPVNRKILTLQPKFQIISITYWLLLQTIYTYRQRATAKTLGPRYLIGRGLNTETYVIRLYLFDPWYYLSTSICCHKKQTANWLHVLLCSFYLSPYVFDFLYKLG